MSISVSIRSVMILISVSQARISSLLELAVGTSGFRLLLAAGPVVSWVLVAQGRRTTFEGRRLRLMLFVIVSSDCCRGMDSVVHKNVLLPHLGENNG